MVRLKRTTRVDGKEHVVYIVLSDNEWRVLKENMNNIGNIKLEVVDAVGNLDVMEQIEPDDKPTVEDRERLRVKGELHYKKGEWSDALHYFRKAEAIKYSPQTRGRINRCIKELNPEKDDNSVKRKPGRPARNK